MVHALSNYLEHPQMFPGDGVALFAECTCIGHCMSKATPGATVDSKRQTPLGKETSECQWQRQTWHLVSLKQGQPRCANAVAQ